MKEVRVCEAMKSPVGTLSDGTVLHQQDGGTKSRQVPIWEKSNLTLEEAARVRNGIAVPCRTPQAGDGDGEDLAFLMEQGQALALAKDDKFHPVQPEIKSGFIALLAVFHDGGLALVAYVHMREYTHVCDKFTELVDLKQTQHYHSYQSGFKWLTRCPHHGHEAHIAVVGSVEGF